MKRRQQGFTLIELMIVVAIIGILAAIAIPAYQDYAIRAQVSEGINLSNGAKTALSQYYADRGSWPADNAAAGLADKAQIVGEFTEHVSITNNVIEIKYGIDANFNIKGETITITATDNEGSLSWVCATGGVIKPNHLPVSCR